MNDEPNVCPECGQAHEDMTDDDHREIAVLALASAATAMEEAAEHLDALNSAIAALGIDMHLDARLIIEGDSVGANHARDLYAEAMDQWAKIQSAGNN